MVRVILIAVLVLLQAVFGIPGFMSDGPYWQRAFLYSFFHGNWWHLSVNAIAIWAIYKYPCKPCRDLVIPFIIAVLVYPLSFRPVIGFSNILYAAIGLRTPSLKSKWWKQSSVIIFLVVTVALVFIPRFSATTHIAAFILGMGCSAVDRFYMSVTKDARRYF
jgi:hypothetical protein